MSDLEIAIITYEDLMSKEYEFKFNKKTYTLSFKRDNLKHLLGIHKLDDIKNISFLSSNKIKSSDINLINTLNKSAKFPEINERLLAFRKIYKLLNNPVYYKSENILSSYSSIDSDYTFQLPIMCDKSKVILFHVKIKEENLIPVSFYVESIDKVKKSKKGRVFTTKISNLK